MSPLHIQVQDGDEWIGLGKPLNPGEEPGSISNNPPGGEREVYFFQCQPDDKSSLVYKAIQTINTEIGNKRILASSVLDGVIELKEGTDPYVVDIRTDWGTEATIRFIHKER